MKAVRELVRKDLLVLRRSPVLAATLVLYPLLVTGLVGLVAGYASAKPRVALVDLDQLPSTVQIGTRRFDIQATIDEVGHNASLVRLPAEEAARELKDGRVVAVKVLRPASSSASRAISPPSSRWRAWRRTGRPRRGGCG